MMAVLDADIRAGIRRYQQQRLAARLNALSALGTTLEHIADARLEDTYEPWSSPGVIRGLGTAVRMLVEEIQESLAEGESGTP